VVGSASFVAFVPKGVRLAPILPFLGRLNSRHKIAESEISETRNTSATSFQVNPLRELPDMVLLPVGRACGSRSSGMTFMK